jgi:hypothetical protein
MSASFRVHRSFALPTRSVFVLAGEITEGMVQIGMRATLRDSADAFSARVHGVEFADRVEGDGSEPALTFSYSKPQKLQRWEAIDWAGKDLDLGW